VIFDALSFLKVLGLDKVTRKSHAPNLGAFLRSSVENPECPWRGCSYGAITPARCLTALLPVSVSYASDSDVDLFDLLDV
jgi:hypothetical protein